MMRKFGGTLSGSAAPVLAAAVALGAALRFWRLGHQSFWYDESVTVGLLHHSLGGMLSALPNVEGTPPVYYCVAWVWARVFGFGEAGIRSLSAVAGVALILSAYGIGSRLISGRAGLVAAWLVACNPFLIWYSQEARAYSLLALMAALALLAFAHLLSPRPRARWIVGWAVFGGLALATHYYAVVALAPAGAWLLWIHRRDPRVWCAMLLVAVVGVALTPLALHQSHNTAWVAEEPLGPRLAQVPAQFVRGTGAPPELWLELAGGLAVVLGAALLVARSDGLERWRAVLAAGLGLTGCLLSLILALAGVDYLITRNLISVLVLLIVGLAGGLGARRAGWLGLTGAAVLCGVGVIATVAVATGWRWQRPGWAGVARVGNLARTHAYRQLVILEDDDSLEPLGLYAPTLHGLPPWGAAVRAITLIAVVRGPYSPLCWWGAACHLTHQTLDTSLHVSGFHPAGPVRQTGQFAILRLVASRQVRVTRGRLVTALQNTPLTSYGLFVTRPG
jgi:hypothetical protein